jgi:hypothetical protein
MKYDSENFSMASLYDVARLLSASHLLAHLLVDRTKKDLGFRLSRQAGACHFSSESSSLPNLAKLIRIFDSRQSSSDYFCQPTNICLPLMLSLLFVCKQTSSIFIRLREMRFNMNRQRLFNAVWSGPLLRQRQSASYIKLLARSLHMEQLPSTTPVRPVCLSSHIKGCVLKQFYRPLMKLPLSKWPGQKNLSKPLVLANLP